jgi:hypothetical protein
VAAAGAVTLVLAGCGTGGSSSGPSGRTGPVGSPEHPVAATPRQDLLAWTSVPGPTADLVTVGDGWTLTVPRGGHEATLQGRRSVTVPAGDHASISDAFLDDSHALVVSEDHLAQEPDRAVLVDLASGRTTTFDARSQPPTAVGGTWALGPDRVLHATSGQGHRYCLATVDLPGGRGSSGWCAQPRHGFSRATVTADGVSMMSFDDHRPSCRTLVEVDGSAATPLPGVTHCDGWDSALLGGTSVWSVVPNERRIEAAHFYAHTDRGWFDLGPGTSGTLVPCAGAAYFVRDPQGSSDPARLLRWDPATSSLTVVFASRGRGRAFLAAPRCGGRQLTVSAYSAAGDQQVTTRVG